LICVSPDEGVLAHVESVKSKVAFCTAHPVVMMVEVVVVPVVPAQVIDVAVLPDGRHVTGVQGEALEIHVEGGKGKGVA
jgi:hypothetical protein